MDDGDREPAALNMDDVFDNDRDGNEQENVAQSTIAEEPSIAVPSFSRLPATLTQSTSALAQSVTLVAGNDAGSTSALAQSTLARVGSNATTTADALANNASAALQLDLTQAVRKTNVPSFICQSLCI
jgi:hypothetical protein